MPTRTRGWIVQTSYHADRFDYERHLLSTCPARKGIVLPCSMSSHDEPHFHNYQTGGQGTSSVVWQYALVQIFTYLEVFAITGYSGLYPGSILFYFCLFLFCSGRKARRLTPVRSVPCAFRMSSSSSLPSIHPSIHPSRFGAQFKLAVLASSPRLGG